MKKKWSVLLAVAGVAVVAAGVSVIIGGRRGLKVATVAAAEGSVEDWYTEEGTLSSGKLYQVISRVSGPVKTVLAEENSTVKEGDVLYEIDDTDLQYEKSLSDSARSGYEAQLEQTRINQVMTASPQEYLETVRQEMTASEADYQSAKTAYEGADALYKTGDVSRMDWEKQKAAFEASESAWNQAKNRYEESRQFLESLSKEGIDESTINGKFYESVEAQLAAQIRAKETEISQLTDRIGDCVVKADRDGIVTELPVQNMSMIQEGETGAVISGKGSIQAEADVLTSVAPYLKPGTPVKIVLQQRSSDQTCDGTVRQVYDYATKGTSALGLDEYRVHVIMDVAENTQLDGKEGYGINIRYLLYQGTDVLLIPSSAVFKEDDLYYVFVIQDGKAVRVPVELAYQTSAQAVVASGVEEGQKVIQDVSLEGIYENARVYE